MRTSQSRGTESADRAAQRVLPRRGSQLSGSKRSQLSGGGWGGGGQGYYYFIFGFAFLVGILTMVITVEVSIVCTYVQLCAEDYLWWCARRLPPPPPLLMPLMAEATHHACDLCFG